MGESRIRQVTQYKYLGIELTRTLRWAPYRKRILRKARRNMTHALSMGISGGFMSTKMATVIWMSLVRSIIEYGCEIWGERDFSEFEKLQLEMGRRILRCGITMPEEAVRGELGWERQKARRDEMRLRLWAKLVRMPEARIAKKVYRESRARMEQEEREGKLDKTDTWCLYTRDLLMELGLEAVWREERVADEWNSIVRSKIHEREQIRWRTRCLIRPKLRTYALLKKELKMEPYLDDLTIRGGIPELAKLRGGANRLRIEQGRYVKERVEERLCLLCQEKKVEDEHHFLLDCPFYDRERKKLWSQVERITGTRECDLVSREQRLNALVGDYFQASEPSPNESREQQEQRKEEEATYRALAKAVMVYVITAMRKRREKLKPSEP